MTVAFGLGANLGDAASTLRAALDTLGGLLEDARAASLYRSAAQSERPQPPYLNSALVGSTRLSPEWLLALGKRLEWLAGRRPGPRWSPRPLDVDLLLYGDLVSADPELTLPHARLFSRRFALLPLAEIAPALPVPPSGITVAALLQRLADPSPVERLA